MTFGMTAVLPIEAEVVPPPVPAPTVLPLKEMKSGAPEWSLALYPAHLALASCPGSQPYVIVREEVMKSAVLMDFPPVFALTKPIKSNFTIGSEAAATLADWIGKPVLARYHLMRRYGLVLPAAILWMFGSMPLPGDAETGVKAVEFDPLGLTLGLLLAASWAWAKLRPQPVLFLVDSLWFLGMGAHLVTQVLADRSKGWLILLPLLVWMVFTGVKNFLRFRGTKIP